MSILTRIRSSLARAIAPSLTRSYEAAHGGKRWDRNVRHGSWGSEAQAAAPSLRAKARHFSVNNPWASNAVAAWQTALVGYGITPSPQISNRKTRKAVSKAFKQWAATCDVDQLTDFFGLQASIVRALVVDGESFVQIIETGSGPKLRLISSELVDANYSVENLEGNRIVAGIEFNGHGERVAYHVTQSKLGTLSTERIRVPAESMLHIFRPDGPGQVRGVSWFAPVLLTLGEFDQLTDALLVGAKVAAMHAGFVTDLNNTGGLPYEGERSGNILDGGIEPGTLKMLPAGMDIRFNSPMQAAQTNEFASIQLRAIAAGIGLPEFLLSGEMRGANYSSMRSALVSFRQRVEQIQFQILVPQLVRPIWRRFALWQALEGTIQSNDIDAECEFYPPAQPWVDPAKDAKATAEMIASGLMSRRQAVAALGFNVEDIDAEIAADRARETKLGLSFGTVQTPKETEDAISQGE